jgi:hypothetical protein
MTEQQAYFEELKTFGALFLNSNELDTVKATENLSVVNKTLKDNPTFVAQLSNPKNLETINKVGEIFKGKGSMPSKLIKASTLLLKTDFK